MESSYLNKDIFTTSTPFPSLQPGRIPFKQTQQQGLHPAASVWHRRALLCHGCDSEDNDSVLTSRPHAGLRREHAGVCAGVACTAVVARGLGHVAACAALGWHLHLGAAGASTFVAHEDKRRRTENGGHNGRAPLAQNYPRRHGSPGACKQLFCGGSHSSAELSRFAQQNCFVRYRACQESFRSNRFSFIQAAPRTEFA